MQYMWLEIIQKYIHVQRNVTNNNNNNNNNNSTNMLTACLESSIMTIHLIYNSEIPANYPQTRLGECLYS